VQSVLIGSLRTPRTRSVLCVTWNEREHCLSPQRKVRYRFQRRPVPVGPCSETSRENATQLVTQVDNDVGLRLKGGSNTPRYGCICFVKVVVYQSLRFRGPSRQKTTIILVQVCQCAGNRLTQNVQRCQLYTQAWPTNAIAANVNGNA
jgi:hypothetical protein